MKALLIKGLAGIQVLHILLQGSSSGHYMARLENGGWIFRIWKQLVCRTSKKIFESKTLLLAINIKHYVHIQCHGNYIDLKEIKILNYILELEIDIFRNSSEIVCPEG